MPITKPMLTQQELDFRLLNLFLLKDKKGQNPFPRISLLGSSSIYIGLSPRNYFPVYLNIAKDWFRLGAYTSEELETNPQIKLAYPETTYLNYQDLLNFCHETQRLKKEYGALDDKLVRSYHLYLPPEFAITIAHLREIFGSSTNRLFKQKSRPLLDEIRKMYRVKGDQVIEETTTLPESPKPPKFIEVKGNKEGNEEVITEIETKELTKPERAKRSKKEIEEELEDLDIQMRLLNLEKQQIMLQQRINKLKRT